jgi:O-acetyl-ADP-ribose deacetylase (regulator of RNase III)
MKHTTGDLWKTSAQVKVVPTNAQFTQLERHVFRAHMGAGVAKQAADLWPQLPLLLGERLQESGNKLYIFQVPPILRDALWCTTLVTFPTKNRWRDKSTYNLIGRSAHELAEARIHNGWETILLPRVGAGLGGLDWTLVEQLLDRYLDEHFTVITPS